MTAIVGEQRNAQPHVPAGSALPLVAALAFSPDGTLACGGVDHTIRLWHPDIDQEVAILTGHSGWVLHLAFAERGHALVSSSFDGTLRVWRALSFEQIAAQERAGVVSRLK